MDAARIGRVGISSPRLAGWSGGLSTSRRPQHPPPPPPCSRPPPLLCSLLTVAATVQRGRGPIRRTWRGNKSGGATDGEVEPPSSPPPPHHHHHHYHHQRQHRVFISATSTQMTTISSIFNLLPPVSQNRAGLMWKNCHNPTTKVNNLSL